MNITKIPVDIQKMLRNALLISISPTYEYQNGNRMERIVGYKYTVILPELAYEKINVKILGNKLMEISDEAIAVKFENVEAKLFCIDGKYDITATATSIQPIKNGAEGK